MVLTLAPSVETGTAIAGGNRVNSWCAQIGPGGRPSMGPVSPGLTPSNAGLRSCWVVLACAVGAGLKVAIAFRRNTSKRGIGCVNAWTPNSGLRGKPVGTLAYALRTNGFRPFFQRSMPPTVNNPHLNRSRRVTCPSASALMISWRFRRAFCASFIRSFDALLERNINFSFRLPDHSVDGAMALVHAEDTRESTLGGSH